MGLSLSSLLPAWKEIVTPKLFCLSSTSTIGTVFRRSITFEGENAEMVLKTISFEREETECLKKSDGSESKRLERSVSFKNWELEEANLETSESLDSLGIGKENVSSTYLNCKCKPHVPIQITTKPTISLPEWAMLFSPRPASELDAAATKVQKFYKSYRTRRNLADYAVVVEELWWKALDFAALK